MRVSNIRWQLGLILGLFVATLVTCPSSAAERLLSMGEIDRMVDALELFRGDVRYKVDEDSVAFRHDAAGLPSDAMEFLERVAAAQRSEQRLPTFSEFERAFEMFESLAIPIEDDVPATILISTRGRRVNCTQDEVVDRTDPYEFRLVAGLARTPTQLLVYQAENHQIELRNNHGNAIVRDPKYLLQPVPLSVTGLWYWRQFEWTELNPEALGQGPLLRVHDPDVPDARILLENAAGINGLPISCSLSNTLNKIRFASRYRYEPAPSSGALWLHTVYRICNELEQVSFVRLRLSEVEFEVNPSHLQLEVTPESRIWDFREPVTKFHGNQEDHWPTEARRFLTRLPDVAGTVGIIGPIDPTAPRPASEGESSDPSVGYWDRFFLIGAGVILVGFWALIFRLRAK